MTRRYLDQGNPAGNTHAQRPAWGGFVQVLFREVIAAELA
jgi:hypothetical protein